MDWRLAVVLSRAGGRLALLPVPAGKPHPDLARSDDGAGPSRQRGIREGGYGGLSAGEHLNELDRRTADLANGKTASQFMVYHPHALQRWVDQARIRRAHRRATRRMEIGEAGVRGSAAGCARWRRDGQHHDHAWTGDTKTRDDHYNGGVERAAGWRGVGES